MNLTIYDSELNRVGHIFEWISLLWREDLRDLGAFSLELPVSDENVKLIKKWHYIKRSDIDTAMIIVTVQATGDTIKAAGYSGNYIFTRRASDMVIKNMRAVDAFSRLFENMAPWPNLYIGDMSGPFERMYKFQTSDKSVFEYFVDIATAANFGFRVVIRDKKLMLDAFISNLIVSEKYSPDFGVPVDIKYTTSDAEYFNVALVAGAGEGADRVTVLAGDTDATGVDRREMYVDARQEQKRDEETDAEYRERLINYGLKQLADKVITEQLSISLSDENISLGNLIAVNIPQLNISATAPVVSMETKIQKGLKTTTATVGSVLKIRRYKA